MAQKLHISFKENDEEMRLFLQVKSKRDYSAFVKEAIEFYIKYNHLQYKLEQMLQKDTQIQ